MHFTDFKKYKKIKYLCLLIDYIIISLWQVFDSSFVLGITIIPIVISFVFRYKWFKQNFFFLKKYTILLILEDLFIGAGLIFLVLTINKYNGRNFTNFIYLSSLMVFLIPTFIFEVIFEKKEKKTIIDKEK